MPSLPTSAGPRLFTTFPALDSESTVLRWASRRDTAPSGASTGTMTLTTASLRRAISSVVFSSTMLVESRPSVKATTS